MLETNSQCEIRSATLSPQDVGQTDRVCVLGAGSSGLTVAKNLQAKGIAFDCLEKQHDLGGNWLYGSLASSVYQSTHTISSKKLTEYTDFPMPEEYPEFPSHRQVLEYLRRYTDEFGLLQHVKFGAEVERAERIAGGGWEVRLASGETRRYGSLIVANGHNWDPRWPEIAGEFTGEQIHACNYKTPDLLADRRVLVVGGGNSGCDIAVESAQHARSTCLSLRRGYHFLPKFFHGMPIDICGERMLWCRMPLPVRRAMAKVVSFFLLGSTASVGLPKPDHKLFEAHPIINSQLIYQLRHGNLSVRTDIERLCGDSVLFTDGRQEPFDLIIYATGYEISFPFFAENQLEWKEGRPNLWLNMFAPNRDDLFFAGLIQPDSGQFGLVDLQSQLIAEYLSGLRSGGRGATWLRRQMQQVDGDPRGLRYVDSPRHLLEVEHFSYRQTLKRLLKRVRRM